MRPTRTCRSPAIGVPRILTIIPGNFNNNSLNMAYDYEYELNCYFIVMEKNTAIPFSTVFIYTLHTHTFHFIFHSLCVNCSKHPLFYFCVFSNSESRFLK